MADDAGILPATVRHPLPDGSTCRLEHTGHRRVMVSRWIGDRCVWGETLDLGAGVDWRRPDVLEQMTEDPRAFYRWNP